MNGRNTISWEEKFKLDVWYVENQSFKLDMFILYKTIMNVIKRKDITATNHVTIENLEVIHYETYTVNRKWRPGESS